MTHNKKILISLYAAFLLSNNLYAEEGEKKAKVSLEDIVIIGEKSNKSLYETTSAVSVISEDELSIGNNKKMEDLINQIPNAVLSPFGAPNIRGVDGEGVAKGVFSLIGGATPRVTTTIDGVNESWTGVNYISGGLWDVEQVEVLRGSQSTTQGRNSIGGAVVMKTKDPTFDFEGRIRAGYESAENKHELAAVVSGPIVDDELAFRLAVQRYNGEGFIKYKNFDNNDNYNESTSTNIRAKLLYLPKNIENLSLKFTFNRRTAEGGYLNYVNSNNLAKYEYDGSVLYTNTREQDSKDTTYALNIDYAISDNLTLETLLSYKKFNPKFTESTGMTFDLDEKSATFESKLLYEPDAFGLKGVTGIYLYKRDQDLSVQPDNTFYGDDEVKTFSLYSDNTFALSNNIDLILGARIERATQKRDNVAWEGKAWEGLVETDERETMLLPKLGLSYKLSKDTIFSLIAKKGYNPGGGSLDWNTSEFYTYEKEKVNSLEFIARTSIFDEKVLLSSNIFYNEYKDYQASLDNHIVNIPKARTYGLEVEANAQVSENLEFYASLGVLKTKILEDLDGYDSIKGNSLGSSPSFSGSLGFNHNLTNNISWGANISKTNTYYSDIENDDNAGDYVIANIQAKYENSGFIFRTYVNNITDELVVYRNTSTGSQVGAPRTIGVSLEYKF